MAPFRSLLEACMQTVVKFPLLQVSTAGEKPKLQEATSCAVRNLLVETIYIQEKQQGRKSTASRGMQLPFQCFFFSFLQDPLPSGVLSPPISPLVHKDPECTQSRAPKKKAFAISLRSSTFLIHTQTLTVQQSIFSEGWPPWRTSEQCEGWSGWERGLVAMKGPVIAFDRRPCKAVVHQMPADKKPPAKS